MANKLTAKQSLFVKEYLIDINATQAAIRAGYSKHTAKDIACENLAKPSIAAAIQKAMDERAERVESEADWILRTIKETTQKCVEAEQPQNVFKGCELLGKHHKLFTDKVEHSGNITVLTDPKAAKI